jgi:translation initiation factor 5B
MGVKITGQDLQKAVAGTSVLVLHAEDEVEDLKQEVMKDLDAVMEAFTKQPRGVFVQASTLGACVLPATLKFLLA